MKGYFVYILIAINLVFGACKKTEYPKETRVDGNYFYSDLNVNGNPLTLRAGTDGYYMFSSYSASTLDSFSVSKFSGEFKQANCESCNNSIRIQINDSKLTVNGGEVDVKNSISLKSYPFFSGTSNLRYAVNFSGLYNLQVSTVTWDFGDGNTTSQKNPTHLYPAGTYKVKLTIKGTSQCESVMQQTLTVGPNSFNSMINASTVGRNVSFTPVIYGGEGPFTYYWDFGDGTPELVTGTLTTSHQYTYKGSYTARLKIKDSQGYTCSCSYNVITKDDLSGCGANISFPKPAEVLQSFGSANISLQFTDENGIIYSSDNSTQPETSTFEILSVEEFERNEKGEPVKRVKLKFNCLVFNGTKKINLNGKEVYIGFAYK